MGSCQSCTSLCLVLPTYLITALSELYQRPVEIYDQQIKYDVLDKFF